MKHTFANKFQSTVFATFFSALMFPLRRYPCCNCSALTMQSAATFTAFIQWVQRCSNTIWRQCSMREVTWPVLVMLIGWNNTALLLAPSNCSQCSSLAAGSRTPPRNADRVPCSLQAAIHDTDWLSQMSHPRRHPIPYQHCVDCHVFFPKVELVDKNFSQSLMPWMECEIAL